MRALSIFSLLLVSVACSNPTPAPTQSRKVTYQPPPIQASKPPSAAVFPVKTVVNLVVDSEGLVTKVIPIEGQDPFLSATAQYAKGWRFSKGYPSSPESPVILSVSYLANSSVTIDIKL